MKISPSVGRMSSWPSREALALLALRLHFPSSCACVSFAPFQPRWPFCLERSCLGGPCSSNALLKIGARVLLKSYSLTGPSITTY